MEDAGLVGGVHTHSHPGEEADRSLLRQSRLSSQDAAQVFARDELHDEKRGAIGQAAVVEDGDDGRVLQPGDDLGLPQEPRPGLGIAQEIGAHDLDGYRALEP